jgi:hypothetical protein
MQKETIKTLELFEEAWQEMIHVGASPVINGRINLPEDVVKVM